MLDTTTTPEHSVNIRLRKTIFRFCMALQVDLQGQRQGIQLRKQYVTKIISHPKDLKLTQVSATQRTF